MGATAFQKGLGAVHAISHPIGAVYGTHHGTTNAVVIPPVLDFNRSAIEDRIVTLNGYLDIKGGFDEFRAYVVALNEGLGIPKRLSEMNVGTNRIEEIAKMALEDPSVGGNPVEMTLANTIDLLEKCI